VLAVLQTTSGVQGVAHRLDEAGVTVINVVPIPKSSSEAHIRENFAAQELDLDDEGVARTDAIDRRERQVDFPAAPWN